VRCGITNVCGNSDCKGIAFALDYCQHHGALNLGDLIDQIGDLELNTIAIDWSPACTEHAAG
jgi:hypothetical protein